MKKQIGKITLLERIGKGATSTVYRGHNAYMEDVAVKLIDVDSINLDQFRKEVKNTLRISHPNVVRCLNADVEDDYAYMVMELVTGGDLADYIKSKPKISWEEAYDFITQTAEGLAIPHTEGMVHRDIKPANLLLTAGDKPQIKIADYGLAEVMGSATNVDDSDEFAVPTLAGTEGFIAPELFSGGACTPAADIFGLGVTFFMLLTKREPYLPGERDPLHPQFLNVRNLRPELPEGIAVIIDRMLEPDPTQRISNAQVLLEELEAVKLGRVAVKSRKPALMAALIAIPTCTLVAAASLLLFGQGGSHNHNMQMESAIRPAPIRWLFHMPTSSPPISAPTLQYLCEENGWDFSGVFLSDTTPAWSENSLADITLQFTKRQNSHWQITAQQSHDMPQSHLWDANNSVELHTLMQSIAHTFPIRAPMTQNNKDPIIIHAGQAHGVQKGDFFFNITEPHIQATVTEVRTLESTVTLSQPVQTRTVLWQRKL